MQDASSAACAETPPAPTRYANHFKIGHNALEFVIDFGEQFDQGEALHLHTRIVTNPSYAKALLRTLTASVQHHERDFGAIREIEPPGTRQ